MSSPCDAIRDYYSMFNDHGLTGSDMTGPFGGQKVIYTVPTEAGLFRISCDRGVNTLGFSSLRIAQLGSMRGYIGKDGGSVGPVTDSYASLRISSVSPTGVTEVQTLFTTAKVQLPTPPKLDRKADS
jgi:hypothetical protein